MKKLLLVAIAMLTGLMLHAQTKTSNLTVKGTVIDSATNQPASFVTTVLQDATTHESVKSTLTKDNGSFELSAPQDKAYELVIVSVGYQNKTVHIDGKNSTYTFDKLLIKPSTTNLNEVSVTAPKPLMKQEVDRLSYDVSADPDAKALTALDMIRKVPLLSVDGSDNIKLRGSGDYKILIDGKESAMMAKSPSDILRAMPATNIVKIEVITTPPAKYDAEGLAGIINIITNKSQLQGYNGSINAGYNSVWGPRLNLNLSIKEGKFGYTGYVGGGGRPVRSSDFENESSFLSANNQAVNSTIFQNGTRGNGFTNFYTSNELSFEIDTLNLLTASFNYYDGGNTQNGTQYTTQRDSLNNVAQAYRTLSSGKGNFNGADFGLNYQLSFKNHKDELLTASYKYSRSGNSQNNLATNDQRINYTVPDYRQYNSSGTNEHTSQVDFVDPLKVWTIEAGGKMILRNNFSNTSSDNLDPVSGMYINNPLAADNFTYKQNVYSVYNSYQVKLTNWTFKGGLRLERTTVDAFFAQTNTPLNQNYNNLVPSVSAQRKLTETSNLTFGFTQRISRPGIWQLNPFVDSTTNTKYVSTGNPNLRPTVNNNVELSYGNFAHGSINLSAHYSFVNNSIQSVSYVAGDDITYSTYANVGKNQGLGLDLSLNTPLTKKWNLNINAELLQVWLKGTYNGTFYTNSGQQGHIFTNSDYKWDSGFRLSTNLGFDSRYVLLQGRDNWYFGYGIGASQDVLNKKATISLFINNPFSKFNTLDFFTQTPQAITYNRNENYYRSFNLSFNYKFGKLSSDIKKAQRGINNDDTTSSGSRN
jgi:hypothetical protein